MSFTWSTEPSLDAQTVDELGSGQEFPDRATAEAWFAEHWTELEDAGAESVTLLDAGAVVYGPMPLSA